MSPPPDSQSCIQGATIEIDAALYSLDPKISWGLERKIRAIDTSLMYGEVSVPTTACSALLFQYKLSTQEGGTIERTNDGMPVVIIYAIEKVAFKVKTSPFMSKLHHLYVIIALATGAYKFSQYLLSLA